MSDKQVDGGERHGESELKAQLEPCPFCGKPPAYMAHTVCCNFSDVPDADNEFRDRHAETVSCDNVQCSAKPRVSRIETGDAKKTWNTRF